MGIAEEAADAGLGNESGEPVQVLEELESCHRQSMTRIHHEGKSSFLRKSSRFCGFDAKNYPLESPKSPKFVPTSYTPERCFQRGVRSGLNPIAAGPDAEFPDSRTS